MLIKNTAVGSTRLREYFSLFDKRLIIDSMTKLIQIDMDDKVLNLCLEDEKILQKLSLTGCKIWTLTQSLEKFKELKQSFGGSNIVHVENGQLPWRDNSFDTIVCGQDIFKEENFENLNKELLRILRPGGQFALVIPWYPKFIKKIIGQKIEEKDILNNIYYAKKELIDILQSMGFTNVSFHRYKLFLGFAIGWKKSSLDKLDIA